MPQYEYLCSLGHSFDLRRGIDQRDGPAPCPQCGGEGQRLISSFGLKQGIYIKPAATPMAKATWAEEPPAKATKTPRPRRKPSK